jgi:hypothetical protein
MFTPVLHSYKPREIERPLYAHVAGACLRAAWGASAGRQASTRRAPQVPLPTALGDVGKIHQQGFLVRLAELL